MERGSIVYLIAVGVVMGIRNAVFRPAEDTFLPQAVPADQLSVAVALNAACGSVAQLSGTAAGDSMFAVTRFVPFLAYAVVCFLLLFLRVPRRDVTPAPTRHLRREIMVGPRWVSAHRHIRVTALCAVRCQSGQPDHGEIAVERRLRLVAGDAALQGGLVRLDDSRQRVSSEWTVPTPFAEGVR